MTEERWLPVVGYEGLYEVSDFGRVRSVNRVVIRSDVRHRTPSGVDTERMRHRTWNRFRAAMTGFFWHPCPLCSREFGGHEWQDVDGLWPSIPKPGAERGITTAICPDCTRAGCGYTELELAGADVLYWRP